MAADGAAGEERKHPVRDRDEDRQQQAEAAELDGDEHEARVVKCRYAAYSAKPDEAEAERGGARKRVPCPAAVTPDSRDRSSEADQPPADRDQHTGVQERRGAEKSRERQHLTAEQSDAHRHVMPRRQRRLVHPAREYRQQEAEEERRQHEILHHDRVQPAGVDGGCGKPNVCHVASTSHSVHQASPAARWPRRRRTAAGAVRPRGATATTARRRRSESIARVRSRHAIALCRPGLRRHRAYRQDPVPRDEPCEQQRADAEDRVARHAHPHQQHG